MKSKIVLLICLLFATSFTQAQKADDIVKSYIDAIGGQKNWDNLNAVKLTGSVEVGPNMRAPFTMLMQDKNKMRFELELQGMKMVQALEGDSGWMINPFAGKTDAERMPPEMIKDMKDQADFTGQLFDYKKKGSTVELLGKEDMEGTEVYKMKVVEKDGDVTYIFLDAKTYLPLKESKRIKMADKEIESASLPSDYRDVNGYKFPFNVEVRSSEEASAGQSLSFETIEVNPKIDPQLFKMPAVKSAVEPSNQTK